MHHPQSPAANAVSAGLRNSWFGLTFVSQSLCFPRWGLLKGVGLNHNSMRLLGRTPAASFAQSPVPAWHERGFLRLNATQPTAPKHRLAF